MARGLIYCVVWLGRSLVKFWKSSPLNSVIPRYLERELTLAPRVWFLWCQKDSCYADVHTNLQIKWLNRSTLNYHFRTVSNYYTQDISSARKITHFLSLFQANYSPLPNKDLNDPLLIHLNPGRKIASLWHCNSEQQHFVARILENNTFCIVFEILWKIILIKVQILFSKLFIIWPNIFKNRKDAWSVKICKVESRILTTISVK